LKRTGNQVKGIIVTFTANNYQVSADQLIFNNGLKLIFVIGDRMYAVGDSANFTNCCSKQP
jgi:hypothetical protein